jgi:hypothetical protein
MNSGVPLKSENSSSKELSADPKSAIFASPLKSIRMF